MLFLFLYFSDPIFARTMKLWKEMIAYLPNIRLYRRQLLCGDGQSNLFDNVVAHFIED